MCGLWMAPQGVVFQGELFGFSPMTFCSFLSRGFSYLITLACTSEIFNPPELMKVYQDAIKLTFQEGVVFFSTKNNKSETKLRKVNASYQ